MEISEILDPVRTLDGALVLAPAEGSGFPEIAWGDFFLYYAPDGQIPANVQPFATIVTKDYPGDTHSALDGEHRWRVNIHVGHARFEQLTEHAAHSETGYDYAAPDAVVPHPLYARQGWIAVVNPAERTTDTVRGLLVDAYLQAKARAARRAGRS
jgi:hypothetical protein